MSYYPNQPDMATWVLPRSSPHPVVMVSSQIVMTSQEEPYYYGCPSDFFIRPRQDQTQYLPPTQRYPVTSGTAGFSLGSSPAVDPAHEQRKKCVGGRGTEEDEKEETGELMGRLRSILNKLTAEKFPELMKQVVDLKIDTAEKLMGAVDVILEKALAEPHVAMTCAKIGRRLVAIYKEAEMEEHRAHIKVQADLRPAGSRRSLTRSQ